MEDNKEDSKTPLPEEKAIVEPASVESEVDYVAEAKKAASELKAGLAERTKILEREEKLFARQEALRQLGGGSQAGARPIPKIETPKEYAERVMSGKLSAISQTSV